MTYTLISDLADSKAGPDENNLYASLISIGKNCVSYKAKDRPEMEQVLRKLDCIMLQEKHCKLYSIILKNKKHLNLIYSKY